MQCVEGPERLRQGSKLDASSPDCSVDRCSRAATIVHRSKPYCGKHALARLEAGEAPDRAEDVQKSGGARDGPRDNRQNWGRV